jgi:hypothetical protein
VAGDPNGDWSRFTKVSGWTVHLLAIGNAPSAILNVLIPGGGTISYDVLPDPAICTKRRLPAACSRVRRPAAAFFKHPAGALIRTRLIAPMRA